MMGPQLEQRTPTPAAASGSSPDPSDGKAFVRHVRRVLANVPPERRAPRRGMQGKRT